MAGATPEAPAPRKAAISFTGGKDSMTVLHMMRAPEVLQAASEGWPEAAWREGARQRLAQLAACEAVLLVTFVPAGAQQSFKAHPLEVVKLQARALGLPHLVMEVAAAPTFLDSYRDNIRRLREEHGVQVLATGDILDVCSSFMPRAAAGTGVALLSPLWDIDRRLLLETMWAYDMAPVITCVNTTKFGAGDGQQKPAQGGEATEAEAGGPKQAGGDRAAANTPASAGAEEKAGRGAQEVVAGGREAGEDAVCGAKTAAAAARGGGGGDPGIASASPSLSAATAAVQSGDQLDEGRALLGRELDRGLYGGLLMDAVRLYGVDACGEWGEYHTMATRSRLFSSPLELSYEVRQEGDYAFLAVQKASLREG